MEPGEVVRTPGKQKLEDKVHILALKVERLLSVKIAKWLRQHKASIDCLLAKTKGPPKYQIPNPKKGSGRPKKVNNMLKRMLKRQIIKYPAMTAAEIQVSVPELRSFWRGPFRRTSTCLYCCYEAPAHRKNEDKEAQVCQDISALYQGRLG
jgi:hypothetical protein